MGDAAASVDGFLPSESAFRFINSWPKQPVLRVRVPPFGDVVLGDASSGLCGGMTYTVRDLFEAGAAPPALDGTPEPESALYKYIVRRLLDSWDIPRGIARYYQLASLPDADTGQLPWVRRGAWRTTVADEWPRIRLDLEQGRLSPVGIITVHSSDPRKLGQNHQVLAYGYERRGTMVTLRVYDPNTPRKRSDAVALSFDIARPDRPSPITHTVAIGGQPVRAFFRTRYRWKDPRAAVR